MSSALSAVPTSAALSQPIAAYAASHPAVVKSRARVAARGAYEAAGAAIDVTFGTHFAYEQHRIAGQRMGVLRTEDAAIQTFVALPAAPEASATRQNELQKNATAALAFNKRDRYRMRVRRRFYGEGVGLGGLVYGGGFAFNSSIFGAFSPALAAASVPMCWVGGPILSVAAAGMGTYEGFRSYRARQAAKLSQVLLNRPVVGNEGAVQTLLAKRLKRIHRHAMVNCGSLFLLTAAAPAAVVGILPGLALAIPGFAGTTLAWYYSLTQLKYIPRLTPQERLQMGGRRNYINCIDRDHQKYEVLKEIKESKRLIYPNGGNRIWGLRHASEMLGAWKRRRTDAHTLYDPAHQTLVKYLQAHTDLELKFYANELTVNTYEQGKIARLPAVQREARLVELQAARLACETRRQQAMACKNDLAEMTHATPAQSALLFLTYLRESNLHDDYLAAIVRNKEMLDSSIIYEFVHKDDEAWQLDITRLVALLDQTIALPASHYRFLVDKTCEFAERFLLMDEKKRFTDSERELLDLLNARLVCRAAAKTKPALLTSPVRLGLPTSS